MTMFELITLFFCTLPIIYAIVKKNWYGILHPKKCTASFAKQL